MPIIDNARSLGHEPGEDTSHPRTKDNLEATEFHDANNDGAGHVNNMDLNLLLPEATAIDEEIVLCISEMKRTLQAIENDLCNYDISQKRALLHQLRVSSTIVPTEISLPSKGSIRQIQEHVTQTRLGHGKQPARAMSMDNPAQLSQPCKKENQSGALRRKHQRGRKRVRFQKGPRIFCPHCCSKTLLLDPMETFTCRTCHALLPLSKREAPIGSEAALLHRVVNLCDGMPTREATIVSCTYGIEDQAERSFELSLKNGGQLGNIRASQTRLVLMYIFG